jgi:[CysO sulfur-carrier protein]-S-L-cysteine hydrolase
MDMDPFRLRVPPPVLDAMLAHARAELPNECVGFLAGTLADGIGTASQCLPLVNELASPTAFRTEPRSVLTAFRAMRAAGTDLLAVYHSHPTSPPVPSRKDVERNFYGPGYPWVIVGLAGVEPEVRAWWLGESDFREASFS